MAWLDRAIAWVSLLMSRVGGVCLLLAALLVSIEILLRKFFLMPFNIGTELSTYALAIGASWSFSQALLYRAHVRVDVLRRLLPAKSRPFLDVLALAALGAFALLLAYHACKTAIVSWRLGSEENTPLGTPLVVPQALWAWGMLWFAIVCLRQLVLALRALLRRELERFGEIAAPVGVDEDLQDALARPSPEPSASRP